MRKYKIIILFFACHCTSSFTWTGRVSVEFVPVESLSIETFIWAELYKYFYEEK